jgi:hypothetical protein
MASGFCGWRKQRFPLLAANLGRVAMRTLVQKAPQPTSDTRRPPPVAQNAAISPIQQLQRRVGNQALQRMLQDHAGKTKGDAARRDSTAANPDRGPAHGTAAHAQTPDLRARHAIPPEPSAHAGDNQRAGAPKEREALGRPLGGATAGQQTQTTAGLQTKKETSASGSQQPAALDASLSEFIAALKKDAAYGAKVKINSTIRSPRKDAAAVLSNQRNDPEYYKIFSRNWEIAILNAVKDRDLKVTSDYEAAVDNLAAWISQDPERSPHGVGKAVDLDLAGGDAGFKSFVKIEAEKRGLFFKDETKHNHYHVQLKKDAAATTGKPAKQSPAEAKEKIVAVPAKPKSVTGSKKDDVPKPNPKVEQLYKAAANNLLARYATFVPFTSTYINLDENGLAAALAGMAKTNGGVVLKAFESLDAKDVVEVAAAMVRGKSVKELSAFDPNVLKHLKNILGRGPVAPAPSLFSKFLTQLAAFEKMLQGSATQSWGMVIYGEGDGRDAAATKASKDAKLWSSFDYAEFAKLMDLILAAIPENADYRKILKSFREDHHPTVENVTKFLKESLEKLEQEGLVDLKGDTGTKTTTKETGSAAPKVVPSKAAPGNAAPNITAPGKTTPSKTTGVPVEKSKQKETSKDSHQITPQKVELSRWVASDASGNVFTMIKYSDGTKRFVMGSIFGIRDIENPGITEWKKAK